MEFNACVQVADLTRYDNHDARLSAQTECFVCRRCHDLSSAFPPPQQSIARDDTSILLRSRRFTFFPFFSVFLPLVVVVVPLVVPLPSTCSTNPIPRTNIFLLFFFIFFLNLAIFLVVSLSLSHTLLLLFSLSLFLTIPPIRKKNTHQTFFSFRLASKKKKKKKKERKEKRDETIRARKNEEKKTWNNVLRYVKLKSDVNVIDG